MKAVKRLIILAMACVFLCTQGIAISEADPTVPPLRHILDISISATPNELVQGGDVTLTLVISNTSEFAATNLYLESVTDLAKRFELNENHISVKLYRVRKKLKKVL